MSRVIFLQTFCDLVMSMIPAKNIIQSMLVVSEKAARVARICRQDGHLLSLLIEEKKENEKNSRFVKDFKTLADVLVQELIKNDIGKQVYYKSLIKHCFSLSKFLNTFSAVIHSSLN